MKKFISALLLSLLAITAQAEPQTVKIVTARNSGWSALNLMPELCKKYNLNVEFQKVDPKVATTSLLIAQARGEMDLIGPSLSATLQAQAAGNDTYIFSNLSSNGIALVARKDSGIKSFADLKGKKVGSMRGSSPETLFMMSLDKVGLTAADQGADVQLVHFSFSLMEQALTTGMVDAAIISLPDTQKVLDEGLVNVIHSYTNMHRLLIAPTSFNGDKAKKTGECLNEAYQLIAAAKTDEQREKLKAQGVAFPSAKTDYVWTQKYKQEDLNEFVDYLKKTGKLSATFTLPANFNRTTSFK